jgi:ribosomal protein S10
MTTESKHIELLQVSNETIASTFIKIKEYAASKGYNISGELLIPSNKIGINKKPKFESHRQEKSCRNFINRLHKRVNMCSANKFLHFLFTKGYGMDKAPSVEYSNKEKNIQAARKAWKKAAAEAEKLRVAYRTEKSDFYKQK